MTACKLAPATLTLPLLIFAGLLGASMLPATDPHPRSAPSDLAVAEVTPPRDLDAPSEVIGISDQETLHGLKNWRQVSDRAAELVVRLEAEIVWHLGRVASH